MYALLKEQMKTLDHTAIKDYFIPAAVLMENAAHASVKCLKTMVDKTAKIVIIAGMGNNGGDGLCLARQLYCKNYIVKVYIVGNMQRASELSSLHQKSLTALGVEIKYIKDKTDIVLLKDALKACDIVVDAIFGISLNREVGGIYRLVIETVNDAVKCVLSLDIPSGLDADTAKVRGVAVRATKTITFGHYKLGLCLFPGADYAGQVICADIGLPKVVLKRLEQPIDLLNCAAFKSFLVRKDNSHKGSFGRLAIVAGSQAMSGAAVLAAKAAYRSGVGIVKVLTVSENRNLVQSLLPEVICYGFDSEQTGIILHNQLQDLVVMQDVLLIGPGLSKSTAARYMLKTAIDVALPLVIDADGLNILADQPELITALKDRTSPTVITPHIGEMARLLNVSNQYVADSTVQVAKDFSSKYNVIVVLKSARTVIAYPDGSCQINTLGNNGMATAGSGDVLSGVIGAMLSGNTENLKMSIGYAVYLHSFAGDRAAKKRSKRALMASDIIDNL